MSERINPGLLLAAARLVYPHVEWIESNGYIQHEAPPSHEHGATVHRITRFDIKDGEQQMALQIALEKLGFEFSFDQHLGHGGMFYAENGPDTWVLSSTKPELLLKCVEAL